MPDTLEDDGLGRDPDAVINHVGNIDQVRWSIQKEIHSGHLTVAVQAYECIMGSQTNGRAQNGFALKTLSESSPSGDLFRSEFLEDAGDLGHRIAIRLLGRRNNFARERPDSENRTSSEVTCGNILGGSQEVVKCN